MDHQTNRQPSSGHAAAGSWVLDPDQSSVTFAHKTFWGMMTVKGRFTEFSGRGEVAADGRTASGSVVVRAASVDTEGARRDEHLRSAMFFDAEKYPEIVFDVQSVEPDSDTLAWVTRRLMFRDYSTELTFSARTTVVGTDTARLTSTVEVDRAEFGMTKNVLGMIKGLATMDIDLLFLREST